MEGTDKMLAATGTLGEQTVRAGAFEWNGSQGVSDLQPYWGSRKPVKSCARRVVPLSERMFSWCAVVACGVALWILAMDSAHIEEVNRGIAALSTQLERVEAQNASLGALVHSSSNPNRILQYALKLGMHQSIPLVITERG